MASTLRTFDARETERLRALEGVPLASFRARAAAFVLDMLVVLAGVIAIGIPEAIRTSRETGHNVVVHFDPFHSLSGALFLVLYIGVGTWLGNGRTPGKRLLGIRVVSLIHDRLTLWQSLERGLGYAASALEGGFGFLQYFLHPNRRTVHDRIAETIVVAERGRARRGAGAEGHGPAS
jgi:uncharacterized RDD family membrane protein YckC